MNRPQRIIALDNKPGKEWTAPEIDLMTRWWMQPDQDRLIYYTAIRYLGSGASNEDIEDSRATFYSVILEASRKSYRPGGPDFFTYTLYVCFKRVCWEQGAVIRKRLSRSESLDDDVTEPIDSSGDVQVLAEQNALLNEVDQYLAQSELPDNHKIAFKMKYFDEMSNEEIAWELGAPVNTVKSWIHRATLRIKKHLIEKGWAN